MIVLKGRIRIRNFVPEAKVWKVNLWNRAGRRFLEIGANKMFGSGL